MIHNIKKIVLSVSLAVNLLIALPAVTVILGSSAIRFDLYQKILAPRFGEPKIVFIGDSITLGGGIWSFRIGRYDFDVWNYGHGGMTSRQIHHYAKKVSRDRGTRYAFIMAGINDPDKTKAGAKRSFSDYSSSPSIEKMRSRQNS